VLVVTKLDRLARSVADLSSIVAELERKGASLRVLNAAIDTSTATGRAFLNMLGVFSEFENDIRRERQARASSARHSRGEAQGRPYGKAGQDRRRRRCKAQGGRLGADRRRQAPEDQPPWRLSGLRLGPHSARHQISREIETAVAASQ
jgi:DNA invertase Pin-like site-specific DNA recombinase